MDSEKLLLDLPRKIDILTKVKLLAKEVWEHYHHLPYGNSPAIGRSVLQVQLNDITNLETRDCKLSTYIFCQLLDQLHLSWRIAMRGATATHPYIFVNVKFNDINNFVMLVSFHAYEVQHEILKLSNLSPVKWESLDSFLESHAYVQLINPWRELDERYLRAVEMLKER